jgi:hypothetical protein
VILTAESDCLFLTVIKAKDIREMLDAEPFKPFRLYLSDGTVHEIPHPELGWVVGESRVFIAYPSDEDPDDPSVKQLSILHLTRLEEIKRRKKAA